MAMRWRSQIGYCKHTKSLILYRRFSLISCRNPSGRGFSRVMGFSRRRARDGRAGWASLMSDVVATATTYVQSFVLVYESE